MKQKKKPSKQKINAEIKRLQNRIKQLKKVRAYKRVYGRGNYSI